MSDQKNLSLTEALKDAKETEDQIKIALDFMRSALNQEGSPRLRDFWDAKTTCLPLFKQRIAPSARSYFWDEFVELSNEARRLKEVLDEQSAFASEQIDKAIEALEGDLDQFDEMLTQIQNLKLSDKATALLSDFDTYNSHYKELTLLTALSTRIGSLKQEVIKTSMRVRQKGRIFEKLQELREKILPKRKKLIDTLSEKFISDVTAFVQAHGSKPTKPFYELREEIKTMQDLSKTLGISTGAFTKTREELSQFWDNIRALDKDRKKALGEKKQHQKDNTEQAKKRLDALEKELEACTPEQAKDRITEMYNYMRSLDLHRDNVTELKTRLREIEQAKPKSEPIPQSVPPAPKIDPKPKLAQEALQEVQDSDSETILKKIQDLEVDSKDPLLDPLNDLYQDARHAELLACEEVLVSDVEELIKSRRLQKKRVMARLETLRKTRGAYSLDFERSMQIDEDMKLKKSFVKTIESAIKELEELIK